MTTRLLHTAFFTALYAYLGFFLLDIMSPGFVSHVFSVHAIGFIALVLGIAWYRHAQPKASRIAGLFVAGVLGLAGAMIIWFEGEAFGDFRALLAIAMLALPFIARPLLSADGHKK